MTQEEKAKAYDEALEKARKRISIEPQDHTDAILKDIFPQLRESEDERIRKYLIEELKAAKSVGELKFIIPQPTREECIAYLEKQKALSELGKYIAAKRTKPGFMFAGNDSVSWEELPLDVRKHDYPYYFSGDLDCYPFVVEKQKEQKPAEWSEEEIEEMVTKRSRSTGTTKSEMGFYRNGIKDAIKRFGLRPSWKPSKDEERLINTSISFLKDFADKGYENAVECIDWLKSKLNGNSNK